MYKFWNFTTNESEETELRIDGDIIDSGQKWLYDFFGEDATDPKSFTQELKKCEGKALTIWINSYGGSTAAASCIYTLLKNRKGETTVKIDGVAISAASVIAMAGNKVLMSPTAIMMIHNPLTCAEGDHNEMAKAIDVLSQVKESIINAYENKTGLERTKIANLMEAETWMSAKKAIDLKFCDGMLYENKVLDDSVTNKLIDARMAVYNSFNPQKPVKIDKNTQLIKANFEFQKIINK